MRHLFFFWTAVFAIICFTHHNAYSQQNYIWQNIGLKGINVTCLLSDDTSKILAGTDEGVYVCYDKEWYQADGIASNAYVTDIIRLSEEYVIVSTGGRSNSDGIYLGEMIRGEPYYSFSSFQRLENASAVALKDDTLFTANTESVYKIVYNRKDNAFSEPVQIPMPDYAFGVEMPVCSDLKIFGDTLYAGGYDISPEPGPGHLLTLRKDSMEIVRQINVTSLASGNFSVEGLGPASLVCGTPHTGFYLYTPGSSDARDVWQNFESPRSLPVNDVVSFPTLIWNDALYTAVDSGVFQGGQGGWTEIGDIPAVPTVVSLHGTGYSGPVAGTENGVYRYGPEPTGIKLHQNMSYMEKNPDIKISHGKLSLNLPEKSRVKIKVFDLKGRILFQMQEKFFQKGMHRINFVDSGRKCTVNKIHVIECRLNGSSGNNVYYFKE